MKKGNFQYSRFLLWVAGILAIFIIRTMVASRAHPPRIADLFTIFTLAGSLAAVIWGSPNLEKRDWVIAFCLGAAVSVGMYSSTLFNPFPFLGIFSTAVSQAVIRGLGTFIATLGGIVAMRLGGPVQFHIADFKWKKFADSFAIGLLVGAPLAILNIYALRLTQHQGFDWQNPLAAILDAWQPAIVEEMVFRFALLGLIWLTIRKPLPDQAGWLSGLLSLIVHNYSHFDDLFLQNPLLALGMGLALAVVWGLPETILALQRGIESSMAFHWIQDAARFLAGY